MLRKILAGLLLIPASFVVHGSLRAWLKALGQGKRSFFSPVVASGPAQVGRSGSVLFDLFVYYPMKTGQELLRNGPAAAVRKAALTLGLRLAAAGSAENGPAQPPAPDIYRNDAPPPVPAEHIRDRIREPGVTVVSFDVFDTLLVRPALRPKDIWRLLAERVDSVHGVDFIKLRWNAEESAGKENATIREIYEGMARQHGLDPDLVETLMVEELRCEETLLSLRPDVRELYAEAARLNKRIIAVSDMYLPGDVLSGILQRKGCPVDAVYVSCDHGARKSDGALYNVVLAAEKAHPAEILHIGDNYRSDYEQAVRKKIPAVWYPSVFERCFYNEHLYGNLFGHAVEKDPLWSVYMGFALN
jgi:FMN phosphatase YigB (HAD superfamily)